MEEDKTVEGEECGRERAKLWNYLEQWEEEEKNVEKNNGREQTTYKRNK